MQVFMQIVAYGYPILSKIGIDQILVKFRTIRIRIS
jgi:hypothetical protein